VLLFGAYALVDGVLAIVYGSLFVALALLLRSWDRHRTPESAARLPNEPA
jgi:hypothetical protein